MFTGLIDLDKRNEKGMMDKEGRREGLFVYCFASLFPLCFSLADARYHKGGVSGLIVYLDFSEFHTIPDTPYLHC